MSELEKLRRTVEATEMIQTGLRDAIVTRIFYAIFGAEPTNAERYCLTIAAQEVQLARAAYDAARLRLLASTDCSKDARDPAQDRSSDSPAEGS